MFVTACGETFQNQVDANIHEEVCCDCQDIIEAELDYMYCEFTEGYLEEDE